MPRIVQSTLSIAFLSIFLGGCSTFSSSDTHCMKTVLVTSLAKMPLSRVMAGDSRDVTISGFKGGCGGSSAQLPGGSGDIGLTVTFVTPETKRLTGKVKEVTLPLFVALLDKEDNIKDRRDENVKVKIGDHSLYHTHKITYQPPEGIDIDSADHRILVGFNPNVASVTPIKSDGVLKVKKTSLKKINKKKVKRKGA